MYVVCSAYQMTRVTVFISICHESISYSSQKQNSLHLQVSFTQINVDKIACTVIHCEEEFRCWLLLWSTTYWLVLEHGATAQNVSTRRNGPTPETFWAETETRRSSETETLNISSETRPRGGLETEMWRPHLSPNSSFFCWRLLFFANWLLRKCAWCTIWHSHYTNVTTDSAEVVVHTLCVTDIFRGCFKGEFGVDQYKFGCSYQGGSTYCFCEGELCNNGPAPHWSYVRPLSYRMCL